MQRSRFHNHDDTSQKPVESSILFGKVPTYSRETFQAKVLLDFDVRIILVSLGLILWYYPQADDAGQCAPQTCTFEKMLEFHWIPIEIMSCSAKNMPQTPERSNAHDQGTAVQHWTEGSSADLNVSRPETWWCVNACLHPSRQFSTILDYLSYCPSYSFMSNANQLQSFTLCGALCSEYQCSINLIQFTVYQSMHSMLSENLTYHTVHHCATARLPGVLRAPSPFHGVEIAPVHRVELLWGEETQRPAPGADAAPAQKSCRNCTRLYQYRDGTVGQ